MQNSSFRSAFVVEPRTMNTDLLGEGRGYSRGAQRIIMTLTILIISYHFGPK